MGRARNTPFLVNGCNRIIQEFFIEAGLTNKPLSHLHLHIVSLYLSPRDRINLAPSRFMPPLLPYLAPGSLLLAIPTPSLSPERAIEREWRRHNDNSAIDNARSHSPVIIIIGNIERESLPMRNRESRKMNGTTPAGLFMDH